MAQWLANEQIDALYTSPLQRARETAQPLAERWQMTPTVVDGIAEYDRHEKVYIPLEEVKADKAAFARFVGQNDSPVRRAWRAEVAATVEELVAAHRGQRIAAVCHGGVINAYLSFVLGIDKPMFFEPEYTSVHRITAASTGQRTVLTMNEAPFLRGLR